MSTTPSEISLYADAARTYVFNAIKVELDGSETSLAFADHYIDTMARRSEEALADDVLELIGPALGAYFGEVAIAKFGGRWSTAGEDSATWRVALEAAPLEFSPVAMAMTALRSAEVPGWDATLETTLGHRATLEQALAASPPVDERYFYSLTGRLEVIAQVAELLIELERQKHEQQQTKN